jgi:hypothetical protein
LIEVICFKTKVKSAHCAVGVVCQFKNRVAQPQISDLSAAAGGMLKVMFKAEVALVELNGTVEIGDMNRHVIDALEHNPILA